MNINGRDGQTDRYTDTEWLKFPKDCWAQLIHTQHTGKALKVFVQLSVGDCIMDFDIMKKLCCWLMIVCLNSIESYSNFAFRLALLFKYWMDGDVAFDDVERMREVVKLEQLLNCLPVAIHGWVVGKHLKLVVDAARLGDEYAVL